MVLAALLTIWGCAGATPPRASSPPAAPSSAGGEPETRAAAEELTLFLRDRLHLTARQQESARKSALAFIERNAQLVEMARSQQRRVLENLRQSRTRFDAEILSILTPDQGPRYLRLKSDLYQETSLRRSPLAPGSLPRIPSNPPPTPTP